MSEIKFVLIVGHKGSVADAIDVASAYHDHNLYNVRFSFDGFERHYDEHDFKPYDSVHLNLTAHCDILHIVNTDNMITSPMQAAIDLANNLGIEVRYLHRELTDEEKSVLSKLKTDIEEYSRNNVYQFQESGDREEMVKRWVEHFNQELVEHSKGFINNNIIVDTEKHTITILDDEIFDHRAICALPLIIDGMPEDSDIQWSVINEEGILCGKIKYSGRPVSTGDDGVIHLGVKAEFVPEGTVSTSYIELAINVGDLE